jgi:phosphoglycolate phosphatase-like HAD superfamily hydrolase
MKLQHAGFNLRNTVLTSSDDSDKRVAIMKKCQLALGNCFHRIVYVGDAQWDIQATKELRWHFIGVGTRLKGKCEFWVEDFSCQDTFMKMLHA